ncbi:FtsK/SpoIIIE domain-containing protein [Pseudonocardia sp. ICBG1142]|uniref:FtsK/SpoIIIE domain-containing protein n=1 Tax=Pseudonocardia sp. ICBG1142 TaxID=2846760 RepID=UPI001CF6165D|nr:FtsK/SpoIIIE domain-containing protein [Pseudonocardia sp. ICBG1142]
MSDHDDRDGREKGSGGASSTHHDRDDALAPVITLHHRHDTRDQQDEPVVIEGEIVTCGQQMETPTVRTPGAELVTRRDIYRSDLVTARRHAVTALTHPATVTSAKALVRNTFYVFSGAGVLVQRWRDTHGTARYERQMRAAEIAGDQDRLLEWEARDVAEKARRHGRVMDWINAPLAWARAAGAGALIALGMLLGLGVVLAIAAKDVSLVIAPITAVIDAVAWTVTFVTVYASLLGTLALGGAVLGLWALGKARTEPPTWTAPPADVEDDGVRDVIPDERAVVNALRHLGMSALNAKFKAGWAPRWIQPPVHDGKGWHCQFLLPEGVTVEMLNKRKDVLAHNLLRLPVEVWPTEPKDKPGVLDLWVADQGSLTKPVAPWPLLHDGTTDYFKGVPTGVNPRSDLVTGRLFGSNWGVAGMMGSGKSTLIIDVLAGAILDPLVEVDIYCMAHNADYDPFRPVARTLFVSDDPDEVPTVLDGLKQLMSELSQRGRKLSAAGEPKLTRKLAAADPSMRPRVVVIDECQELFVSDVGAEAAELVSKIVAKARKYGITLLFATPVPSAESLPRAVAKVLSNRACFAIGDHHGNDAILGTGKHTAGITATTLQPMTINPDGTVDLGDLGTAMTTGFGPCDGLMRCFYIPRGDGIDELTPIIDRAIKLREEAGIVPGPAPTPVDEGKPVDHLADIAEALRGQPRVLTRLVLARLVEHNRTVYEHWGFTELAAALAAHDIPPRKSHGQSVVRADDLHTALTHRDRNEHHGTGEDDF